MDPIGSQLLVQILLIAINAFFASTETALVSVNDNKVRRQAEEGDAKAKIMLKLIESPSNFLSTIQVCITLSGFLASAFAADGFATMLADALMKMGVPQSYRGLLDTVCLILITLILSFFMIVLGELAPKRIAMQNPDKVARMSCGVINFVSKLFKPIVWLLTVSTNGILRLCRINPNETSEEVTEEEIRMLVDIGSEKGAIEEEERNMIENIFEFNNMTAADVMVHRIDVVSLHVGDSSEEILSTIRQTGLSRFPVYDTDIDDIVGILNTRDFLLNAAADEQKPLRELLRNAYLVPETVAADTLFSNMQKQKIHLAVVVDEYGGMSGIVTMEDLLEEIVGNIYDEFDPSEDNDIEKLGDNLWKVSGTVDLETLSEALDMTLPLDEEYDTLGGLVFSTFSFIPEDGSTPEVEVAGLKVKVEEICDHRIEKALVSKLAPAEENNAETSANAEDATAVHD